MGANNSTAKYRQNIYDTPPKATNQRLLLFDPRSPTDEISRTPIQIDHQFPAPNGRLYNHVPSQIIGPDFPLAADQSKNNENHHYEEDKDPESKRTSGVEPTLDPTKVLTDLVANNNGQLPPYQL